MNWLTGGSSSSSKKQRGSGQTASTPSPSHRDEDGVPSPASPFPDAGTSAPTKTVVMSPDRPPPPIIMMNNSPLPYPKGGGIGPPPPLIGVASEGSTAASKRPPLDMRRPIDPVFRSGSQYATPSIVVGPPNSPLGVTTKTTTTTTTTSSWSQPLLSPTIHVFDPTSSSSSSPAVVGTSRHHHNDVNHDRDVVVDGPNVGLEQREGNFHVVDNLEDEIQCEGRTFKEDHDDEENENEQKVDDYCNSNQYDYCSYEGGGGGEAVIGDNYDEWLAANTNSHTSEAIDETSSLGYGRVDDNEDDAMEHTGDTPPADVVDYHAGNFDGQHDLIDVDPIKLPPEDIPHHDEQEKEVHITDIHQPSTKAPVQESSTVDSGTIQRPQRTSKDVTADTHNKNNKITNNVTTATFHTPIRPPKSSSKLVFLSDQKSIPTDLRRLEERTYKHRRDVMMRLHELECHTARLTSVYAEERMDLSLAICDTFDRTIVHPLESSIDRLSVDREASNCRAMGVTTLERRVAYLDERMTHHTNVTLSDVTREQLDGIGTDLHDDVASEIRLENAKYDKIEGGIVRRFETVAGGITKEYYAECASRRATMDILEKKIVMATPENKSDRLEQMLCNIANLRAQLRQERADRIAADQALWDRFVRDFESMKRAFLVATEID